MNPAILKMSEMAAKPPNVLCMKIRLVCVCSGMRKQVNFSFATCAKPVSRRQGVSIALADKRWESGH